MAAIIRNCKKSDEPGILNICYRTGLSGEDLIGTNRFNDIRLFGYLFILYYLWYEPENGFVAVDEATNEVVGYIFGTRKTRRQEFNFVLRMGWRIILRYLFYTSWRYPETFKAILYFITKGQRASNIKGLYDLYPAHFHINILPEYQSSGTGSELLAAFQARMAEYKVPGIHLRTSNKNHKALKFYEKHGFSIVYQAKSELWQGVDDYYSIIMVKKL